MLSIVADAARDYTALTHFIVVELHVVCPPKQLVGMCLHVKGFIFRYIYIHKQDENAGQPEHQ